MGVSPASQALAFGIFLLAGVGVGGIACLLQFLFGKLRPTLLGKIFYFSLIPTLASCVFLTTEFFVYYLDIHIYHIISYLLGIFMVIFIKHKIVQRKSLPNKYSKNGF